MTRQDLIEILTLDGTQQQIEEAIAKREMTDLERDKIYDFLRCDDKQKANEIFKEILDDIVATPTYETGKEEKKGWAQIRQDVANEINTLKVLELDCKDRIANMENTIETLRHEHGDEIADKFKDTVLDDLTKDAEDLSIKTKQHGALALMHAEAKSMEAQARGRMFVEATQPFRDTMTHAWGGLKERATSAVQHTKNLSKVKRIAHDLDFHPVENTINKIRISWAKTQVKELNKLDSKIHKIESELLKKANKISEKNFKKEQWLNSLKSWSKGETVQAKDHEKITDVNKAKETIEQGDSKLSKLYLKTRENTLEKLRVEREKVDGKVKGSLERVAEILRDRKENVQQFAQNVAEQEMNGELGKVSNRARMQILNDVQKGMESSFIKDANLSKDLKDYMKDHDMGDVIGPER